MTDREPGGPADGADPPFARSGAPCLSAAILVALLVAGCGAARGGSPAPDEGPAPDGRPEPERPAPGPDAPTSMERIRALVSSEPARALRLADSLYFALRARPDAALAPRSLAIQVRAALAAGDSAGAVARLRELLSAYPDAESAADAALRLAGLLRGRGDDPGAVAVLLRHGADGDDALALLRRAAGAMSVAELERAAGLAEAAGAERSVRSVVAEELARARELAGGADPVRVGVLLPDSGRFAGVARWLRQGMRIALEESGEGPPVEVVARDLSSGSPAGLLADLEAEGVAAVIGPLRADGLSDAARSRSGQGLLLVSPTAVAAPRGLRNAYALRDRSRRELDAAAVLGDWVGSRVRPGPVGAVYPRGELGRRSFLSFRRALGETGGGWIVASAAYDPGATTLEAPVTEVSAFRPEAVFAGAEGTSSLLQMAPQLAYYGIRAALVLGGPDWTRPGAVRRLDPVYSQLRVGATFAGTGEGEGRRERFRAAYETRYRTTLGDNVLPMLGHDAALLVRRALAETSPARPRAVARTFARLTRVEGATGLLEPDPEAGAVGRRIALRALADRQLRPVSAAEAREWLASTGRLATAGDRSRRTRARRAVRDARIPLEPQETQGDEGGEESR